MAPRYVRIRLPEIPSGLPGNLIGLAGLILVAVAVGALAGNWWWTALVGGAICVVLSWLAGAPAETSEAKPAGAQVRSLPTPAGAKTG